MEYLRNIPVNLQEVKPHILLSVPALAKNFRKNIEAGIKAKGRFTDRFYHLGLKIAYTYNGFGDDRGRGWRALLKPLVKLWDSLLFSKLRKQVFGGNLRFFVGGGALLDIELQRYYAALGIPMFQGYGLSEASPVISSNTPGRYRFGSSGILVKPIDLKVCDEEGQELPQGQKRGVVDKRRKCDGWILAKREEYGRDDRGRLAAYRRFGVFTSRWLVVRAGAFQILTDRE